MAHHDTQHRDLFLLATAAALLWGWNYGLWDLYGNDEGRYVQVAKELLGRGNWLLLTVHGEPYPEKPPLVFWMLAGMLKLNDGQVSAWAVRLPSVLMGMFTVLLVADIGRRRFGRRAGLMAGFVILTAPLFARQTPTSRLDVIFTGWVTAAMWVWLTADRDRPLAWMRAIGFWLFLTGAFFIKGPLALLIVLGPVLIEARRERSVRPWRAIRPLAGLTVLLGLIGGWLGSQYHVLGAEFVHDQVATGTFERIFSGSHHNPIWYYAYSLMTGAFMPWTLFLIPALVYLWRRRKTDFPAGMRPVLSWIFLPLLVLHLSFGKRHQYLLPLLPPMALVVGWFIDLRLLDGKLSPRLRAFATSVGLVLATSAAVFAILAWNQPESFWLAEFYILRPHIVILGLFALLAAGVSIRFARQPTFRAMVVYLTLILFAGELVYLTAVKWALNPRNSTAMFATELQAALPAGENVVGALGKAEKPEYHVYGNYEVRPLKAKNKTFKDGADLPTILVARAKDEKKIREAARRAGYRVSYRLQVSGDEMMILDGRPAPFVVNQAQPGRPLVFAFAGDSGTGEYHQKRIVKRILEAHQRQPLAAIFLLGDNVYSFKPFPVAFEKRFRKPFAPLIEQGVPFYGVLGNHEDSTEDITAGEINSPLLNMNGKDYYQRTFNDGLVTFFILDSRTFEDDPPQQEWFQTALNDCRSDWKILLMHVPIQASDIAHGIDEGLNELLQPIISAKDGIDIVMTGHNHVYERRALLNGVLHVTVGSSGKLETDSFPPDENRVVGYQAKRCFAWMEFENGSIRFRATNEDGETIDDFFLAHAGPGNRLTLSDPRDPSAASIPQPALDPLMNPMMAKIGPSSGLSPFESPID